MPERILTLRELNRATLSRQHLLARRDLSVTGAIEAVGPLQAQWSPSPYIALWSRVAAFERAALTRALERRRVIKAVLMRGTLHLVTARDFPFLARMMREDRMGFWRRFGEKRGLYDGREFAAVRERVLALAAAPRTRQQLFELIAAARPGGRERTGPIRGRGMDAPRPGDGAWAEYVFFGLRAHRDLVSAPPDGVWGTYRPLLVSARAWIADPGVADLAAARTLAVRRYLTAFGPASRTDLAAWAGMPVSFFDDGIKALGRAIVRFRDEDGRELLDLARARRPAPDTAAPPRYLAKWDSVLLAYAPRHRVRILPERYREAIIGINGDTAATFLVDGVVAGTWTVERKGRQAMLRLSPFGRLARADRAALVDEGERLVRFVEPRAAVHGVK